MSISVSQNDTQCIENPTGEVSLNVAVRGVPGPEGPQGHKEDIGHTRKLGSNFNIWIHKPPMSMVIVNTW